MKVSVITPTWRRQRFLKSLVAEFNAQTHADKELLILDDSPEPAEDIGLITGDGENVRYFHSPRRMSIGTKRNMLIAEARGEVIMQFDDDDYYTPFYIEKMLVHLGDKDLVTLNGWYAWGVTEQLFCYWDTLASTLIHYRICPRQKARPLHGLGLEARAPNNIWGYGFSYVYRKAVHDAVPFPDMNHEEDINFVRGLQEKNFNLATLPDTQGLVLHILHEDNTSMIFPQYLLPAFLMPRIFPGAKDLLNLSPPAAPT